MNLLGKCGGIQPFPGPPRQMGQWLRALRNVAGWSLPLGFPMTWPADICTRLLLVSQFGARPGRTEGHLLL